MKSLRISCYAAFSLSDASDCMGCRHSPKHALHRLTFTSDPYWNSTTSMGNTHSNCFFTLYWKRCMPTSSPTREKEMVPEDTHLPGKLEKKYFCSGRIKFVQKFVSKSQLKKKKKARATSGKLMPCSPYKWGCSECSVQPYLPLTVPTAKHVPHPALLPPARG